MTQATDDVVETDDTEYTDYESYEGPWVYNGVEFKPGDRVLIAYNGHEKFFRKSGMGHGIDWQNTWSSDMRYGVGGVHEIEEIDESGVKFVEFVDDTSLYPHLNYRYPLSVLVKQ